MALLSPVVWQDPYELWEALAVLSYPYANRNWIHKVLKHTREVERKRKQTMGPSLYYSEKKKYRRICAELEYPGKEAMETLSLCLWCLWAFRRSYSQTSCKGVKGAEDQWGGGEGVQEIPIAEKRSSGEWEPIQLLLWWGGQRCLQMKTIHT